MNKYSLKDKEIKPHNILFAKTTEIDYEMERLILLENMPNTNYNEYILAEGYHCSCYDFNDTEWNCVILSKDELKKILEGEQYGLRKDLKVFVKQYWGQYDE